jgi:hypothetical protein
VVYVVLYVYLHLARYMSPVLGHVLSSSVTSISRDLNRVGDVFAFLASGLVVAGIGIRITLVHTLIERWYSTYVVNRSVGDNVAFVVNPCHMPVE